MAGGMIMAVKPIVIVGATATGKSQVALTVAERLGGEIVGADAVQMRAGLEILTASPSAEDRLRVPHHLVGLLGAKDSCSAALFCSMASEAMQRIQARGRVPLLVGGTGLYVKAVTHGLTRAPSANEQLRARFARMRLAELLAELAQLGPSWLERVDLRNRRRVERALERAHGGQPIPPPLTWHSPSEFAFSAFFLHREREELHERIADRTVNMFAAGVVEEVRNYGPEAPSPVPIGFELIWRHLRGEIDLQTCQSAVVIQTRQFARRQEIWFRKQNQFESLKISLKNEEEVAEQIVQIARRGE